VESTDYTQKQAKSLLEGAISIYQAIGLESGEEACRDLAWAKLWLGQYIGDVEDNLDQARVLARQAMNTFREASDSVGVAECLLLIALSSRDPIEAKMLYQEQLVIHESNQDHHGMQVAHGFSGTADILNGEYEDATQAFNASIDHARRVNNPYEIVEMLSFLGVAYHYCGDLEQADECIQQSLQGFYEFGMFGPIVDCLRKKSELCMAHGRYKQVAEINQEALHIARRTGVQPNLATALALCIRLDRLQRDIGQAQLHAEALLNLSNIRPYQKTMTSLELGHLALGQGNLAEASSQFQEMVQHIIRPFGWSWHVAPAFDGVALLALRKGSMEAAAHLFGSRWCRGYANFLSPIEKAWRQPDWEAMQAVLGEEQFEDLHESGKSMTFPQAVDLASEIVSQDRK
jgi:tetratricopeptide (TPR) repeat protein